MKNIIYTVIILLGIFLTITESDTMLTNIIGTVILVSVAIKKGLININEFINK